jgi:hypothetical protein
MRTLLDHSKPFDEEIDQARRSKRELRSLSEVLASFAHNAPKPPPETLLPLDHSKHVAGDAPGPATFPLDPESRPIPAWVRDLPQPRENPSLDDPEWRGLSISPHLAELLDKRPKFRLPDGVQERHQASLDQASGEEESA